MSGLLPERPVVLVTGASRGVGRGIAHAMGELGARVYLTGRAAGSSGGALDAAAAQVERAGGTAVPVRLDHRDDEAVAELFGRIEGETEGLDLLVNNAFGTPSPWVASGGMWEHPVELYDTMHDVGIRSSYVATWHALQAMVPRSRGAIVNVSSRASRQYFFSAAYGIAKAATDKLTADLAHELGERPIGVFSVWPDLVRTEFYEQQVTGGVWPEIPGAQDPLDVGRAVIALLRSPDARARSGEAIRLAELMPTADPVVD